MCIKLKKKTFDNSFGVFSILCVLLFFSSFIMLFSMQHLFFDSPLCCRPPHFGNLSKQKEKNSAGRKTLLCLFFYYYYLPPLFFCVLPALLPFLKWKQNIKNKKNFVLTKTKQKNKTEICDSSILLLIHSFFLEGFWNFLVVTHRINKGSYVYISLSPRKTKKQNIQVDWIKSLTRLHGYSLCLSKKKTGPA